MDSPPKFSETLEFIVQFLRAEGFYAAEEALVREIENRCPDGSSPTASSQHNQLFAPPNSQPKKAEPFQFGPPDTERESVSPIEAGKHQSGNEDWRGRGELPDGVADDLCRASSYDQPYDSNSYASSLAGSNRGMGTVHPDVDEYSDDDDVGYVREYIRGQEAFVAREVDQSDEDGSQLGMRLYHKAQEKKQGVPEAEENGEDDESSDGQGSSYFSGELIDHGNSLLSQVSNSSRGAGTEGQKSRMVTVMEPVNPVSTPTPLPALPAAAVVQQPASPKADSQSTSHPTSHPLSRDVSSDSYVDSGLVHEPSLGTPPHDEIAEAQRQLTTDTASSTKQEEASQTTSTQQDGGWARGLMDPLGMFGKVFGGSRASAPVSAPPTKAPIAEVVPGVLPEDEPAAVPEVHKADQPAVAGREASVASEGVEVSAGAVKDASSAETADRSDAESSCPPETPKTAAKTDGDCAFSFPVTPPSEPPAAAEPGHVFGTWPSLKNSSYKYSSKGDLGSGASSEYNSGYNTDEEGNQSAYLLDSCQTSSQMDQHPLLDPAHEEEESSAPSSSDQVMLTPHSTMGSAAPKAIPSRAGPASPVSIQPLDMSTSLPHNSGLDLASAAKTGTASSGHASMLGAAQAVEQEEPKMVIKPAVAEYGSKDQLHSSRTAGDLTERTMENAGSFAQPSPVAETQSPGQTTADGESMVYQWDESYMESRYEVLNLKVVHRRRRTGFEETKDISIHVNDLIASRYQVTDFLGSAAFSQAVQALDIKTGMLVCLKIIKNNKDYFDQSLDEIKLLKYVNEADPAGEYGILQLYDYFYYKEHLFLVCELLRANLYEFQKYNREHGQEPYFTVPRIQSIARQVLESLAFMHSLDLIHCDLKPENILIKSYSRCEVKVIDLGSSCFTSDHLSSYVQSRSYRAPEVILGLPYHQQVDIWSLGCILAELLSGYVLLQNDSLATLLARLEGILGPMPKWMLRSGRYAHRYYTRNGAIFEESTRSGRYELLRPKRTSLRHRIPDADDGCLDFLSTLLTVDPKLRPTAAEALQHPWLSFKYPPITP